MRKLLPILCLTLALLLLGKGEGWNADFEKGWHAYIYGNYETALREWKPLAEQGDARAQQNVGVMYNEGKSVPQNDKTAVKWYRLATLHRNFTS